MSDVQNSLREIAELLLLLHESYLSQSIGSSAVVEALLLFVRDIGLGEVLSVIEVERCRRRVMLSDDAYMGYEQFYEWLRMISNYAHQDEEGNYRRALHYLLMQNVIPAASQGRTLGSDEPKAGDTRSGETGGGGGGGGGSSSSINPTYDMSALNLLLTCSSFLELWYVSIMSGSLCLERCASVETLWRRYRHEAVDCSLWEEQMLLHFELVGLLPGFISRAQVQMCVEKHMGAKGVSFNAFLAFLEEVSGLVNFGANPEAVDLEFSFSPLPSSSSPSADVKMLCLLQIVAESLLSKSISRFRVAVEGEPAVISGDSLLLMLRHAGLVGRCGHSLQDVYSEALIYADRDRVAGVAPTWALDTMKISLCSIVEYVTGARSDEPYLNLDKFSPSGRVTVYLLMLAPGLFFAVPQLPSCGLFSESLLAPSASGASAYQQSWPLVEDIFQRCEALASQPRDRPAAGTVDGEPALSTSVVLRYLEQCGISPLAISPSLLVQACDYVLGGGAASTQPALCSIKKVDLLEVLYVLAQWTLTAKEGTSQQTRFLLFVTSVHAAATKGGGSNPLMLPHGKAQQDNAAATDPSASAGMSAGSIHKPLRDVLLLLMHFPLNSLQLNPWTVSQLFAHHSSGLAHAKTSLTSLLPLLFKEFSARFGLSAEALGSFFAAFFSRDDGAESAFDGSNNYMLHEVKACLSVSVYPLLMHDKVLRLLQRNQLLLHWEFFKCASRSFVPSSTIITDPLPGYRHMAHSGRFTVVSMDAAVLWAQSYTELNFNEALSILQSTKLLGGARESHDMAFSSFVLFAVRCFTFRAAEKEGPDFSAGTVFTLLRSMLETFSANLSAAQTTLEVKVSDLLADFSAAQSNSNSADKSALLRFSFAVFGQRSNVKKAELFLPPKPPLALWDAPRFISYCKFGGLTARADGLLRPWRAFGAALRMQRPPTIESWKPSVVPPLPLRADVRTVRDVLGHFVSSIEGPLSRENVIDEALHSALAPLMIMYVDDEKMSCALDVRVMDEASAHSLFIEDLLRYGGQAVVAVLEVQQSWVAQAYGSCKSRPEDEEASQTRSLALLCCGGLLDGEVVDAAIRHSLHPRLRRNTLIERRVKPGPPLARCEFEEALLRSAYAAWVLAGAAAEILPDSSKLYQSLRTSDIESAELKALALAYCGAAVEAMTSRRSDTWGVDYLSPFVAAMIHRESVLREQASSPFDHLPRSSSSAERLSDRAASTSSSPRSSPLKRDGSNNDLILQSILAEADESQRPSHGEQLNPTKYPTTESLLDGTKENLWPVYATYCSCGDSMDPGKLSGPNLFTLLSKLGILTNKTNLSDVGILIHQISAHTQSLTVTLEARISPNDLFEPPSLSFEEFLVFLCAFSQLYYDGLVTMPMFAKAAPGADTSQAVAPPQAAAGKDTYSKWQNFLETSASFHRLLEERILPILKRYPLLAFPDDARQRDRYSMVFSLEVLLAVESSEKAMLQVFKRNSYKHNQHNNSLRAKIAPIALALKKLIPQTIDESQLFQLVYDVLPEVNKSPRSQGSSSSNSKTMLFPQWEWVLCIISFHAIEFGCSSPEQIEPKLVGELVAKITTVMSTLMSE